MKNRMWSAALAFAMTFVCVTAVLAEQEEGRVPTEGYYPFDTLVERADHIFQAECTSRETVYENGNIVTKYKLKPGTVYKGRLTLDDTGEIEMEEFGGALDCNIPLAQAVPNMAGLSEGEEVLLFTSERESASSGVQKATSSTSSTTGAAKLQIIGGNKGRYSIVHDPENGESYLMGGGRYVYGRNALSEDASTLTEDDAVKVRAAAEKNAQKHKKLSGKLEMAADDIYQFEQLSSVESRLREKLAAQE